MFGRLSCLLISSFSGAICLQAQSHWFVTETWPPLPPGIRMGMPHAAAVDRLGRILILHRGNPPIVRLERDGTLDKAWGNGIFKEVHSLRIAPDESIWVTDVGRHIIVKFSPDGNLLQTIGTPDEPGLGLNHFGGVADLAFLPNGDFYVADGYLNSRIVKFDKNGEFLLQWGKQGEGPGEFQLPHSIALDPMGRVYVADRGNKRIQVFGPDGKFVAEWRAGTPYGLAFTPTGELWMSDMQSKQLKRLDDKGAVVERIPLGDPRADGSDLYVGPHLFAIGPQGSLILAQTSGTIVELWPTYSRSSRN
jgi:DNA-binding beta-propeller fold protein YncE